MKLKKPLVVLDLETTGTWVDKDRIIEIAMICCGCEGDRRTFETRVNPDMPIPAAVTVITGIKDGDVKDKPLFKEIAPQVKEFIGDADLAGFNIERFDLPMLLRELSEAGIELDMTKRAVYDAQQIFHYHEKRDLTAAYRFYCDKDLVDAHSALADTQATLDIMQSQIKKYCSEHGCVEELSEFRYKEKADFHDRERKFRWWNGELYMMFGKYAKKEPLRSIAQKDRGYLEWILSKDFSPEVKAVVQMALNGKMPPAPAVASEDEVNELP